MHPKNGVAKLEVSIIKKVPKNRRFFILKELSNVKYY